MTDRQTDGQTDNAVVGNNSLYHMHSMQPNKYRERVHLAAGAIFVYRQHTFENNKSEMFIHCGQ